MKFEQQRRVWVKQAGGGGDIPLKAWLIGPAGERELECADAEGSRFTIDRDHVFATRKAFAAGVPSIGMIGGRFVSQDDPEFVRALAQVTAEGIPPGDYGGGVLACLLDKFQELRKPFVQAIQPLTLMGLRAIETDLSWQQALLSERIQGLLSSRRAELWSLHGSKRIPGLTRLRDEAPDPDDRAMYDEMIQEKEAERARRIEGKERRQDASAGKPGTYLITKDLKRRGWTEGLIDKLLGPPDLTKRNPHYAAKHPTRLYLLERVEQVEASSRWHEAQADIIPKREAAKRGVETKRRKIEEYIESVVIEIPELSKEQLILDACAHYNAKNDCSTASPDSKPVFLERIAVNYLRHHDKTRYHDNLDTVDPKIMRWNDVSAAWAESS